MKTKHLFLSSLLVTLLGFPLQLFAQKEMPITTSSEEAIKLYIEGRDKIENADLNAGIALLKKAVEKDPNFAMAYCDMGQRKNIEKAVSLIDKVSEGEKHYILWSQAFLNSDGEAIKKHKQALLKLYPNDKRINYYVGVTNRAIDHNIAIKYFNKAIELDENYAPPYNMLGYVYMYQTQNYEEAEKIFKKYITLIPNSPNGYDSYAELLLLMGRHDESIEQYQNATAKDETGLFGQIGIGHNYVFKGDFAKARQHYQKIFEKTPREIQKLTMLRLMASSYVLEGKLDKAISKFDEYCELAKKQNRNNTIIAGVANQGHLFTELDDPVKGFEFYKKAGELVKTLEFSDEERENQKYNIAYWRCYGLIKNKKFDVLQEEMKAMKDLMDKRKNPYDEKPYQGLVGLLEFENGNYEKAIDHFSKSNTNSPNIIFYTALAYDKTGDTQKAKKLLKRLKTWNLNSFNYALVRNRAMEKLKKLEL